MRRSTRLAGCLSRRVAFSSGVRRGDVASARHALLPCQGMPWGWATGIGVLDDGTVNRIHGTRAVVTTMVKAPKQKGGCRRKWNEVRLLRASTGATLSALRPRGGETRVACRAEPSRPRLEGGLEHASSRGQRMRQHPSARAGEGKYSRQRVASPKRSLDLASRCRRRLSAQALRLLDQGWQRFCVPGRQVALILDDWPLCRVSSLPRVRWGAWFQGTVMAVVR